MGDKVLKSDGRGGDNAAREPSNTGCVKPGTSFKSLGTLGVVFA